MSDHAVGGDDSFTGISGQGFAVFYGDAGGDMSGHARGGNDTFEATDEITNTFYGDAGGDLGDHAVGGNDTYLGGHTTFSKNLVYGDAMTMSGSAKGGDDILITDGFGNFYGDVGTSLSDKAVGGNDTLTAELPSGPVSFVDSSLNMFGDAGGNISDHAVGGNDAISVQIDSSNTFTVNLIGDAGGNISNHAIGGDDTLTVAAPQGLPPVGIFTPVNMYGDAVENIQGYGAGGNDVFSYLEGSINAANPNIAVYGDAGGDMSDHARGGNDTFNVTGSHSGSLSCYGDAGGNMIDHAEGGDDLFLGSGLSQSNYLIYGDAGGNISDRAVGGNDTFLIKGGYTEFYGDAAGDMSGHAHGGNDSLEADDSIFFGDAGGQMSDYAVGGDDSFVGRFFILGACRAYGDALMMSDHSQGGNDTLRTADTNYPYFQTLVGDAQTMTDWARGGDDTLISGTGRDDMWGDAQVMTGNAQGGDDTFVFSVNNGHDRIEDFGQGVCGVAGSNWGVDQIDVRDLGVHGFNELAISAFDATTHESTITFSPGNDVVVHSQVALTDHDFIFG